jgi:hypothetical protein
MKFPTLLVLGVLLFGSISTASADPIVVTFDDLVGQGLVPFGYGGINWFGTWEHYGYEQPPYTAHSTPQRADSVLASDIGEISDVVTGNFFAFLKPDQIFLGAWFAGWSTTKPSDRISFLQFILYNDGEIAAVSAPLVPTKTPTFLDAGYRGHVDEVGIFSNTHRFWAIDDVTYEGSVPAPTPEPGTLLLLSSGFAGLLWRWRACRKCA